MNIKENVESILSALANKDYDAAGDLFNSVMAQKAAERLNSYKVDVADQYFNGFKEGAHDESAE